jgi:hypothetical protein
MLTPRSHTGAPRAAVLLSLAVLGASMLTTGTAWASSSSTSKQLKTVIAHAQAAKNGTFKAVYLSSSNGSTQTITIEQQPPKSVFSSGTTTVINNGTTTYVCYSHGQEVCISEKSAGNPLAGLQNLYSPNNAVSVLKAAQSQVTHNTRGYHVSFANKTFAGLASTCVTITGNGQHGKYCVTKSGILAYDGANGTSFQLTSYTTHVSSGDFNVPAGATVQTQPNLGGG